MKCVHCRGEMPRRTAPVHVDRDGCHVVLDAVPAWLCQQCTSNVPVPLTGITILEFPSVERARARPSDPECAPSHLDLMLVEGCDG